MSRSARPPVFVPHVLQHPERVRGLIEANGPYYPVQRYFGSEAEYRASAGKRVSDRPMIIAPNFRGDWAYDRPLIDGVTPLLENERFVAAAGALFGGSRIRPFSVYSNITWQLPFDQGGGHTDVPEFRGIDRTRYPTWLLQMMGHSRLFEAERVEIATAVAWFYEGVDGGFQYWPDGPDAPSCIHEGQIFNTAIVGDNDRMYHRVRPVGDRADGLLTDMTLDSQLVHREGQQWAIVEGDRTLAELGYDRLRISVSWKAHVFRDELDERRYLDHTEDLALEEVFERFHADLAARGLGVERSSEPLADPALVEALAAAYVHEPTVFEIAGAVA